MAVVNSSNASELSLEAQAERAFERPGWYLTRMACNIRIRCEVIQEFTKGLSWTRVLDMGCGDGSISVPLIERTRHLMLVDRSTTMLSLARSRGPAAFADRVQTQQGDVLATPLEPKSYDLVICLGVLPYVDNFDEFIGKISS